jgi:adenosine deaminase
MKDYFSEAFLEALTNRDLAAIRKIPKADLHNHFTLGGNRDYIRELTGVDIPSVNGVLASMEEMHNWNAAYLGNKFNNREMRKLLIDATFVQAKIDGVRILEIGEDVWGLGEYFDNDIDALIHAFQDANQRIAPEVELRLQIGLSRHCPIDYLMDCLKPFWGRKEFYSIDLYADEFAQPIENFVPIYQLAKENGLRLKAHIGEWGTAEDIVKGIELLQLDEVQHGIAAVNSDAVIRYLLEHKIRLNITPSSNVKLGRVPNMEAHPIQKLYRSGVNVTINSDDILIFDSDVSKEYLRLYENHVLTPEELDDIRLNGLRKL